MNKSKDTTSLKIRYLNLTNKHIGKNKKIKFENIVELSEGIKN